MGHFSPEKRALFQLLKSGVGGRQPPLPPTPPVPRPLASSHGRSPLSQCCCLTTTIDKWAETNALAHSYHPPLPQINVVTATVGDIFNQTDILPHQHCLGGGGYLRENKRKYVSVSFRISSLVRHRFNQFCQ